MGLFGRKTVIAIQILLNLRLHSLRWNGEYSISRAPSHQGTQTQYLRSPLLPWKLANPATWYCRYLSPGPFGIFSVFMCWWLGSILVSWQWPIIIKQCFTEFFIIVFILNTLFCVSGMFCVLCAMFWTTVSPQHKNISLQISKLCK